MTTTGKQHQASPDWHQTLPAALVAPIPAGARSALLLRHGSMSLRLYQPRGQDPQTPHDQDEIYVIARGSGTFLVAGERFAFRSGDVLFAPAGAEHRFEAMSEDFATWVVFWGPVGGEAA